MEEEQPDGTLPRTCAVLCVEDEAETCDLIQRVLPEHRVVFAATAREALTRLYSNAFDAYLLEYYLPDWNGVQLCREIRKSDPHVPVIFYTTAAREEDRARAIRAGASAYLVKPLDPETLRSRLRVLLTLSLSESLKAQVEERRAIHEELRVRAEETRRAVADARLRGTEALRRSEELLERLVRAKALVAYIAAGGTRAEFEHAWPEAFAKGRESAR